MSFEEFLTYAVRFATHASVRSDDKHHCGIALFTALQQLGGTKALKKFGARYVPERNALWITRRGLDKFMSVRDAGYRLRQFDRGKVFMAQIVAFAADETLDDWFDGEEDLELLPEEKTLLKPDNPTEFQGLLFLCSPSRGELCFCIAQDRAFIERFRKEAKKAPKIKDKDAKFRMEGFPPQEQCEMLMLDDHWNKRSVGLTRVTTVWSKPSDAEAVRQVIELIRTVPRSSLKKDQKADAAEGLFAKLYAGCQAEAALKELMNVTPKDTTEALNYIIKIRDPKPRKK